MALEPNESFSSVDRDPVARVIPLTVQPKTFAAVGAAPLYSGLVPVTFNTSTGFWEIWDSDGANGTNLIKGFLFPDDLQTDAADETVANVLMEGKLHYSDIVLPAGELQADLLAACISGPRGLGLMIQGVAGVH